MIESVDINDPWKISFDFDQDGLVDDLLPSAIITGGHPDLDRDSDGQPDLFDERRWNK